MRPRSGSEGHSGQWRVGCEWSGDSRESSWEVTIIPFGGRPETFGRGSVGLFPNLNFSAVHARG